jgi:translation initiation factor IF-1
MAKQSTIEQDGSIIEALSNAMFRVELERTYCNAHISGKMRMHYIKLYLVISETRNEPLRFVKSKITYRY